MVKSHQSGFYTPKDRRCTSSVPPLLVLILLNFVSVNPLESTSLDPVEKGSPVLTSDLDPRPTADPYLLVLVLPLNIVRGTY